MIDFGSDKTFIENYQKLKSSRKMSELYGCNKTSILNHAKKIGYDYSGNKEIKIADKNPQEVYDKYLELGSIQQVGEYYGCSGIAVSKFLKKFGYPLNKNYKLSNISDEKFIQLYDKLKSAEKVGEVFNCSATAVLQRAHKIGYDVNSNKEYPLSDEDKKIILDEYMTTTSTELAKRFNVNRGMVTKLWYDAGLLNKPIQPSKTVEKDITGQQFGKWTVLYKTNKRASNGNIMWHCRCECGIERDVSGLALRNGQSLSCGIHHNISKGNEAIKQLLMDANIPFEPEKKFPTCKDINLLPFDFYVNNSYLIEYDGRQHFMEIKGLKKFNYEMTKKHDSIKSQWCKDNNIPLIRIPYTHFKKLCLEDLLLETSKFIE